MTAIGPAMAAGLLFVLLWGGLFGVLILARRTETPGARGLAAWYAQTATLVAGGLALGGLAELITGIIGYISPGAAYQTLSTFSPVGGFPYPGGGGGSTGTNTQAELDVVLGIVLMVIGAGIGYVHMGMARKAGVPVLELPGWGWWASPVLALIVFGIAGVSAGIGFISTIVSNIVESGSSSWASELGTAVAFIPAWLWLSMRLFETARQALGGAPVVAAPAAAAAPAPYYPPAAPPTA